MQHGHINAAKDEIRLRQCIRTLFAVRKAEHSHTLQSLNLQITDPSLLHGRLLLFIIAELDEACPSQ